MISNAQFVNITAGEVRITALAQNAAGKVSIFSLPFSVPTGGVQVALDTILGRNREISDLFNKPGRFAGSTTGNEVLVEKTGSITLKDDFVYLNNNVDAQSIAQTKSMMRAIAMGDIFNSGGVNYKVVGTNGVTKLASGITAGKAFGLLTALDGMLIEPQSAVIDSTEGIFETLKQNVRVTAYNKNSVLIMFEILTTFDENKAEGYRFVYTLNSNFQYAEQNDANEISFDQMMLCDVRYIDKFFYQGLSNGETGATVPARQIKVGTAVQSVFKADVNATKVVLGVLPTADFTQPDNVITTAGVIAAYTPATNDICVAYLSTKKYAVFKYNGTAWALLENDVDNTTVTKTVTTTNANGTYDIYDFDFEAEDFAILA